METIGPNDLHYLKSILEQLKVLRRWADDDGTTLSGEVLSDNIDWLDCYIDRLQRKQPDGQ